MYAVLIPFLLAANVNVDDPKWIFGPELSFSLRLNYVVNLQPEENSAIMYMNSTMRCRPGTTENLLCHLSNSTSYTYTKKMNATENMNTEQLFEMRFNERGVETLLVDSARNTDFTNYVRKIASQFNLGVDLKKRSKELSRFMMRENTLMGNCATMVKITREEPAEPSEMDKEALGYAGMMMVPLVDEKPGTSIEIEKIRMGCPNSQYLDFMVGIFKLGRFHDKITFNGVDKFETFSEIDGKMKPPPGELNAGVISYKNTLEMKLLDVQPAQGPLVTLLYSEPIDLKLSSVTPTNVIE